MSEDGWLNVWECDTDLDGLKPVEESDKGAKQIEVSEEDESDNEDDDVSNKKKESGTCSFLGKLLPQVLINKLFEHKIVNIFLPISFNIFWVLKRTISLRWFF